MQLWFILSLVFAVLIAFFAVLNSAVVTIQLGFWKMDLSQSVVILGSAAIGAIVTTFFGIFNRLKSSLKTRELKNQVKELEGQVEKLQKENENLLGVQPDQTTPKDGIVKEEAEACKIVENEISKHNEGSNL